MCLAGSRIMNMEVRNTQPMNKRNAFYKKDTLFELWNNMNALCIYIDKFILGTHDT